MTTYHTDTTCGLPAPSDHELIDTRVPYTVDVEPVFPYAAHDLITGELVVIVDRAPCGNYVDLRGHLHQADDVTDDLRAYAAMKAADAQDELETQLDAVR